MKTYAEKIKDPRWQKKRLEVFERDGFKCQMCKAKEKTLHAHHMVYFKNYDPWDYDMFFIITICEECHSYVHENNGMDEHLIMKNVGKLQSTIDFADGQKSYDIGGIMRFLEKSELEIGGDYFEICKVERVFNKENDTINFKLVKQKKCECEPFQSCEKCSN